LTTQPFSSRSSAISESSTSALPARCADAETDSTFGPAQDVEREVEHLDAQVHEHAAARDLLLLPPLLGAPVGALPEPAGLGVEDLAELAAVDELLEDLRVLAEAVRQRADEQAVGLVGGLDHLLGLGRRCARSGARPGTCLPLSSAAIASGACRKFGVQMSTMSISGSSRTSSIAVVAFGTPKRWADALRLLLVAIDQGDELDALELLPRGNVADLPGHADADQRRLQDLLRHASSFGSTPSALASRLSLRHSPWRDSPSRRAARARLPPASAIARSMWRRSSRASSPGSPGPAGAGCSTRAGRCAGAIAPCENSAPWAIACASSRTLPGQP
jgi:hypothetical protein